MMIWYTMVYCAPQMNIEIGNALCDTIHKKSINNVYGVLMKTKTWYLVPSHKAKNLIGCYSKKKLTGYTCVYIIKKKSNSTKEGYKDRLVVKGFKLRCHIMKTHLVMLLKLLQFVFHTV
jgi:hypothetical protein